MHLQLELSQGIDEATRRKMQTVKLDKSVCGVAFKSQGRLEIQNLQNMLGPQYDFTSQPRHHRSCLLYGNSQRSRCGSNFI